MYDSSKAFVSSRSAIFFKDCILCNLDFFEISCDDELQNLAILLISFVEAEDQLPISLLSKELF